MVDELKRFFIIASADLSHSEVDDVLDLLILLAKKHAIYFRLRPNLTDEGDNLIFECAFSSNSDYLVTSNVRDFKNAEWRGVRFETLTPAQFCQQWRSYHE